MQNQTDAAVRLRLFFYTNRSIDWILQNSPEKSNYLVKLLHEAGQQNLF